MASIIKINHVGEAYTFVINTTEKELDLEILIINIKSVDIVTSPRDNSTYKIRIK